MRAPTSAGAGTTPCSPSPTDGGSSAPARAAGWWTSSPTPEPGGVDPPARSRRLIGVEVVIVLALSLGADAAYSIVDLLKGLIATAAPLPTHTPTLYAPPDPPPWPPVTY